jgi:hypothetical protein
VGVGGVQEFREEASRWVVNIVIRPYSIKPKTQTAEIYMSIFHIIFPIFRSTTSDIFLALNLS